MNQEIINKIIRKKIIWAEIKSKEQEYNGLTASSQPLQSKKLKE